jgi:hypothetical protein
VATFLGAANLLLGYRTSNGVRFTQSKHTEVPPREVVAVLRPEEVELAADGSSMQSNFVGYGEVHEVLFGGSIERLRVRMPTDGPVPAAPGRDDGAIMEVSRTLPQQREFPVLIGDRVAVGARRVHVLPTPISSFTVVAPDEPRLEALSRAPLLMILAERMQTRVAGSAGETHRVPAGMPVVATGPGSAAVVEDLLRHGAEQLLCLPPGVLPPEHVVISVQDAAAQDPTLAVAASLLRHIPAQAVYMGFQAEQAPEHARGSALRELLDLRNAALDRHGLDMRTELRTGDAHSELLRELARHEQSMLVLGQGSLEDLDWQRLADFLEGPVQRPLLVVRPSVPERGEDR